MILSGDEILSRLNRGDLVLSPAVDQFQIQQHSVDLRLGFSFMLPKSWELTNEGRVAVRTDHLQLDRNSQLATLLELEEGQVFDLLPGEYVVVSTLERIRLPLDLMGILYPRSSVNRRGLSVDLTGIIDAGYEGNLIIPVRNNTQNQVIRLYPGERFCQVVFETIEGTPQFQPSRWHNRDVVVTIQEERSQLEMDFVRQGQITELKRKYIVGLNHAA